MGNSRKRYLTQFYMEKVLVENLPSDTSSIEWDSDDSSNDPDFRDPATSVTMICPSDISSDSDDESPTTALVNMSQNSSNTVTNSVCKNPDDTTIKHVWNKTQHPVPAPLLTSQCGPTDFIEFETRTTTELFLTLISDEVFGSSAKKINKEEMCCLQYKETSNTH
jgi:hypothetical protein